MRLNIELEGIEAALQVRDEQEKERADTNVFLRGLGMMRAATFWSEAVKKRPVVSALSFYGTVTPPQGENGTGFPRGPKSWGKKSSESYFVT